jgi:hypothetical protein
MRPSEQDMQTVLLAVLMGEADPTEELPIGAASDTDEVDDGELEVWIDSAATFADDGVMTLNKGLVVRLSDGTQFQLTIVRSR